MTAPISSEKFVTSKTDSQGSSPSLQRARKPYNLGNFLIGSTLALFSGGVYTFSISSVKQDAFVRDMWFVY